MHGIVRSQGVTLGEIASLATRSPTWTRTIWPQCRSSFPLAAQSADRVSRSALAAAASVARHSWIRAVFDTAPFTFLP